MPLCVALYLCLCMNACVCVRVFVFVCVCVCEGVRWFVELLRARIFRHDTGSSYGATARPRIS
jgi:hypothetical protein